MKKSTFVCDKLSVSGRRYQNLLIQNSTPFGQKFTSMRSLALYLVEKQLLSVLAPRLHHRRVQLTEDLMFAVNVERFGDMAVIECEGRIVQPEAAYQLRNTVIAESDARIIILDLSEVSAVEGGGLGMLAYLQRWALDHDIRIKLFNPSRSVRDRLDHACMHPIDVASLDEMTALLMIEEMAQQHYTAAA
jgi:anti-anti-sigma regulatory factor